MERIGTDMGVASVEHRERCWIVGRVRHVGGDIIVMDTKWWRTNGYSREKVQACEIGQTIVIQASTNMRIETICYAC